MKLFHAQNKPITAPKPVGIYVSPDAITFDADGVAVEVTSDREWTVGDESPYLRASPEHVWLPAIPEGEEQLYIESNTIWSIT